MNYLEGMREMGDLSDDNIIELGSLKGKLGLSKDYTPGSSED